MAKQKAKKAVVDSLKEVKKYSKAIFKLLKGLKKKNNHTAEYKAVLQKAIELDVLWLIAMEKHLAEQKEVKLVVAKKKKK